LGSLPEILFKKSIYEQREERDKARKREREREREREKEKQYHMKYSN